MPLIRFTFIIGLMLSGVACQTSGLNESLTEAKAHVQNNLTVIPNNWQSANSVNGNVVTGWIDSFDDEMLLQLVKRAQEFNYDLRIAAANLDRSRALARQARSVLSPTIDFSTNARISEANGQNTTTALNPEFRARWEIDIWGRLKSGQERVSLEASAAERDLAYLRLSLAADVGSAYFLSIDANRRVELAQKIVETLTETLRIVRVQYENGITNNQDLSLVKSDLASALGDLAATQGLREDALRALETLIGRYPSASILVRTDLPTLPNQPMAGIPSRLLERRPDIVAAERRIAAALHFKDETAAAQLPSVTLTGTFGGSSPELSDILDPTNILWRAASNLLMPIVDGGFRKAQSAIAQSDLDMAVASYGDTALLAFREVEQALSQGEVLRKREVALTESLAQANKALKIAEIRFKEGASDLLDVLSIQQRVFRVEANQISIERARLEQVLALNLALGGSWQ